MVFSNFLLVLLPAVVLSGPNTPEGWSCKPLTQVDASHDDCVAASSYDNGVWSIQTTKVNVGSFADNAKRFCVVTLTGAGVDVKETEDFYVRAKFLTSGTRGPYGGLSFNMEDADNGNYVMMRIKVPVDGNVEIGKLENKLKGVSTTTLNRNKAVEAGDPVLEILVKEGEEDVWIGGNKDEEISKIQPYYVKPGGVGFAFQNVAPWNVEIQEAEVCTVPCYNDAGDPFLLGQTYKDGILTCTCKAEGFECACGAPEACGGGLTPWVDEETCETKCVPPPAYCRSTGDPHYGSFDGLSYDFHGVCTYQAASCGDFTVNFKNVDLHGRAPRYTGRMELNFQGQIFSIERGWQSKVDDVPVNLPYIKTYNNGDKVEIINNGQLEIRLYSKGRNPSVRLRATNYNTWINAEMWLHGSCADITEGMCGNWNNVPGDDLTGGSPNALGVLHQLYDENCPAPPLPPDPCRDIDGHDEAEQICSLLTSDPFKQCNGAVPVGDRDNGLMKNCMMDVCLCFNDPSCACAQFDDYANTCQNHGFDLKGKWTEDVEFCPLQCPEPTTYKPDGSVPVPTCLDKNPVATGTARGCYCPDGKFLQDGECVDASGCKCLYEGNFYNNGETFEKDDKCPKQTCTCKDGGEMVCEDVECPVLDCASDELEARKEDECCKYCLANWVVALNPDNQLKKGQTVQLTCEVMVEGVRRKNIVWKLNGEKITEGISKNKLILTVENADADDDGTYTCEATKDGKTAKAEFEVDVVMPVVCEHEDGHKFEEGTTYNPQETEECTCDPQGVHHCACIDDGEECVDPTPVVWFNDNCVKTCVPEPGHCSAAADPFYKTFDGSEFAFKGDCKYNFFGCGEINMYADHMKEKASSVTKSIEVAYKTDVFKMEGGEVMLNDEAIAVPMHKSYADGSELSIEDIGTYIFTIKKDGMDPLISLRWDKVSSYSIDVHGSCKGFSTGMCGTWDDNKDNDMTGPEGDVLTSVEEFGTAWAVNDEEDCPEPPPPVDECEGMDEKPDFEKHVADVFKSRPFAACTKAGVDLSSFAEQAVQQICMCFGDKSCACALLNQGADACRAAGVKISDAWQLAVPKSECDVECPEGSLFKEKGPKPAPNCNRPNGGKKSQAGCFCPNGQMLEDGKCVSLENCRCEYGGKLYDVGEKFEKAGECKMCQCKGSGEVECEDKQCKVKCKENEIEVEDEEDCCPKCLANWVEAVNPNPETVLREPLELTCKVNGVEVDKENVEWFGPGDRNLEKAKQWYSISEDGLKLTIKVMDKRKEGDYKCVVTKDDKSSEGEFEVALPVKKDLVEAKEDTVEFEEGGEVTLTCTKLEVVTELTWSCNGKPMVNGENNAAIKNKKAFSTLTLKPAKMSDEGTCTCNAKGLGAEDSAEFTLTGKKTDVDLVEAKKDNVEFEQGKIIKLTCKKLATVDELTWKCNGKDMDGQKRVRIIDKKSFSQLIIRPAEMADEGKCTCNAKGEGSEDSAEFTLTGKGIEVTFTPDATEITCTQGKVEDCAVRFAIKSTSGAVPKRFVKICAYDKEKDKVSKCKRSGFKQKKYFRGWAKTKKPGDTGDYVAEVTIKGQKFLSDPVSVTIKPKEKKRKKKGD